MGAVKRTHPLARERQQLRKNAIKIKNRFDSKHGKGAFVEALHDLINHYFSICSTGPNT